MVSKVMNYYTIIIIKLQNDYELLPLLIPGEWATCPPVCVRESWEKCIPQDSKYESEQIENESHPPNDFLPRFHMNVL